MAQNPLIDAYMGSQFNQLLGTVLIPEMSDES